MRYFSPVVNNAYAEMARGRTTIWPDKMVAAFPPKTFDRVAAALTEGEDRTDFVREAVERELKRRERSKPKD